MRPGSSASTRSASGGILDQHDPSGSLAERALGLVVTGVPDQHHGVAAGDESLRLGVHLRDERAGGVDDVESAGRGLLADGRCHPVRGEDDGRAVGHLVEFVDEHRALLLEVGDHARVVHDLAADVHRPRVALQREFDDVDRALDAGAERARSGEQDPARTDEVRPAPERRAGDAQRRAAPAHRPGSWRAEPPG